MCTLFFWMLYFFFVKLSISSVWQCPTHPVRLGFVASECGRPSLFRGKMYHVQGEDQTHGRWWLRHPRSSTSSITLHDHPEMCVWMILNTWRSFFVVIPKEYMTKPDAQQVQIATGKTPNFHPNVIHKSGNMIMIITNQATSSSNRDLGRIHSQSICSYRDVELVVFAVQLADRNWCQRQRSLHHYGSPGPKEGRTTMATPKPQSYIRETMWGLCLFQI